MEIYVVFHNLLYTDRWADMARLMRTFSKVVIVNAPPPKYFWACIFILVSYSNICNWMLGLKIMYLNHFFILWVPVIMTFLMNFINPSLYWSYTDIYLGNSHSCHSVPILGRRESHICLVKHEINIQNQSFYLEDSPWQKDLKRK